MVVQHNISAMTANRYYGVNNKGLASSLEKLASGYAINKAGDNAAGLAVSEKMRAQIGGLTQASKNAEDGISMVQTFEGALQETDSILQRMRTLAVQSANGSYQDDVDREAIQLEFDQLNDELNQIADTDYNGIIALNGGEMSDGLKVTVDDKGRQVFDYKGAKDTAAQEAADAAAAKKADEELLAKAEDFCDSTTDTAGAVLDNSHYSKTDADAIWTTLGLTPESSDITNPDELQITFTYDGSKWAATGVTDGAGEKVEVDDAKLAALTATADGNGGFAIDGTSLNLVFNTSDVQKYDTATVKVQNVNGTNDAPDNVGVLEDSFDVTGITAGEKPAAPTVTLAAGVTDAAMDVNMKEALDALQGAEFTLTYAAGNPPAAGAASTVAGSGGVAVTGATNSNLKLYTTVSGNDTTVSYSLDNGTTKIDLVKITAAAGDGTTTAGAAKFKLDLDHSLFVDDSQLTANTVGTPSASKPVAGMFDEAAAAATTNGVSVSNNFKNAERNLTYTDNMTLQVGARTKDSVKFTFEYSTDGIGDLEANMNCSARKGGLETALLDLRTQEGANEAIDKIDNAINKISMVRGTFGAIQNRLEHKINNIDTNTENMTAAESRIRDTQMDKEMMKFTSSQILSQASQSMLAQANQLPQGVLQLLG